jgi:ribosomal protein S18 acetylase RimI-like enzyme
VGSEVPEMNPKISLRPVTAEDMAFLFKVYESTRAEEMALAPWSDEQKEDFLRQQFHIQNTQYSESYSDADFQVIVVDGRDAGRLYVDRGAEEIRIIDISLLPDFRGRGIGGSILRAILDEAEARMVVLHVLRTNPAIRLYQRLGFAVAEELDPFLRMQWSSSSSRGTSRTTR